MNSLKCYSALILNMAHCPQRLFPLTENPEAIVFSQRARNKYVARSCLPLIFIQVVKLDNMDVGSVALQEEAPACQTLLH